ncbi:hypothetical protein P170DRAFT_514649 [Aspergillus steynii IBT 23096]|uniref:Zn(2)-C6 fungal-type domain-containing protein n=1 Tax=Aspergillus steynii IBT 23096 TaxID=1392250 RepID=A0A2I2FS26_9EURO|nr:uncharacterized protein P170DRAFT_514649 [Aspergillus steynii IBT 23096]PLB43435.1 hypothetical protein P170DRAFT_514649 [Aspergillus steynii IBT 23096]
MPSSLRASYRSKTCHQCRSRKVRCDGRPETCSNCDRLQFSCSFQTHSVDTGSSGRPERLRAKTACTRCHSLKVRCSGHVPSCVRCQKRGKNCVYPSTSSVTGSSESSGLDKGKGDERIEVSAEPETSLAQTKSFIEPDIQRFQAALDTFFARVYPLPGYSFLHRISLYDRFHRGEVDNALLLSIVATTTTLIELDPEAREYGFQCLQAAERIILNSLGQPSIMKTQALLLIIRCKMCIGEHSSAFPLVAILARMAFSLRLNYERPGRSFIAHEARRRLMWAVYMLDTIWAGGLLEFTTCPVDAIHQGLPCQEENFELDSPPEQEIFLYSKSQIPGLLASSACIAHLRDQVLRCVKKFAAGMCTSGDIIHGIQQREADLQAFHDRLPQSVKYSDRNLRLRAHSPWLCRFIFVNLLWHQCHCDLYRCITTGLIESIPASTFHQLDSSFVSRCQERCALHAETIAEIFMSLMTLSTDTIIPLEMAACAYQEYGSSCLEIVKRVSFTSPSVQRIETDLKALLDEVLSPHQSSSPESHPPTPDTTPRQVLSIHSLIIRSEFGDDSDEVGLADEPPNSEPRSQIKEPFPNAQEVLPSLLSTFSPGSLENDMWLEGTGIEAWDKQETGFDLMRQMQWDGTGYLA